MKFSPAGGTVDSSGSPRRADRTRPRPRHPRPRNCRTSSSASGARPPPAACPARGLGLSIVARTVQQAGGGVTPAPRRGRRHRSGTDPAGRRDTTTGTADGGGTRRRVAGHAAHHCRHSRLCHGENAQAAKGAVRGLFRPTQAARPGARAAHLGSVRCAASVVVTGGSPTPGPRPIPGRPGCRGRRRPRRWWSGRWGSPAGTRRRRCP